MAGGRGQRLAPYTSVLPKPLMPVGDRPIIDVLLRQLVAADVERVTISVGYLGSLLESWIRQEGGYDIPIDFVYEEQPLGTAGAIAGLDDLDGTFLALNGDILTTLDFRELVAHHRASRSLATVAVKERTVQVDYGVVHADAAGRLVTLEEKPQLSYSVSMGVYAFEAEIQRTFMTRGDRLDFPDLLLRMVDAGRTVSTYPFEGYWRDIGNRDDYDAANIEFAEDSSRFLRS